MDGSFKNILGSSETLFKNDVALDYSFQPKIVPYREKEQREVASCLSPLFQERTGKNMFIFGQPGVGKTVACKHILKELEEETSEIIPLYINCWQRNTTYKIILEMCDLLDFKFVQNKKTEELFKWVKQNLNKKSVVFVFDEVDKLEDHDFLYSILEEIYRKSILLITNYGDWIRTLDNRINSRLMPSILEFVPYNYEETKGILKQRAEYAFYPNVWDSGAFESIVKKTFEMKDLRIGLHLMRESGIFAENKSSRKILLEHVNQCMDRIEEFSIKQKSDLDMDEQSILDLVKNNSGKKIGELFRMYQDNGGTIVYRSFQRRIDKLQKNSFLNVEKTEGGNEGNTTIINYNKEKKLTDF